MMIEHKQRLPLALAGGAASAIVFLTLNQGGLLGVILGYFAPLPLLLAGLGLGFDAVLWSAGLATLLVSLVINPPMGISFFLTFVLPVLILVRMALISRPAAQDSGNNQTTDLEWYPVERIVLGLCLYACAGFALVWLAAFNGPQGGLLAEIQTAIPAAFQKFAPLADENAVQSIVEMAPFIPGLIAISWFTTLAVNATFGQSLLKRLGFNLRPTPALHDFRPPAPYVLLTGLAAVFTTGEVAFLATNLSIILAIPYFLAGLAILHWSAKRRQTGNLPLIILYAALFLIPWLTLIVVFIGVADQAMDIRGVKTASSNQEKS